MRDVTFALPDGDNIYLKVDFIPRPGEDVSISGKSYKVKSIRHIPENLGGVDIHVIIITLDCLYDVGRDYIDGVQELEVK